MEDWFAEKEVQEGGVVGLYNEEKELLKRNVEELWAYDDRRRVGPYVGADEVRIPRRGGDDSDLARQIQIGIRGVWMIGEHTVIKKKILYKSSRVKRGR